MPLRSSLPIRTTSQEFFETELSSSEPNNNNNNIITNTSVFENTNTGNQQIIHLRLPESAIDTTSTRSTPLSMHQTPNQQQRSVIQNADDNNGNDDDVNNISTSSSPSQVTEKIVAKSVTGVSGATSGSQSLNWWRLSAIAFVFTSCGPFGIETCMFSGGAALTMFTIFFTPLVYVIPQVLMVSELSMMMPSNHGHIAWVERGWGRFAGAFNAYNSLLTNSIDLSLYPVLGGNYFVAHFFPGASGSVSLVVRTVMVLIGFIIAARSAKIVADAAVSVSLIIIVPFLILFVIALPKISPSDQWGYKPPSTLGENGVDWASFSAASLWLYTGWNSLGALGGDVEGGGSNRKIFVKGLSFALVWDILMYFLPLAAALVIPGGDWADGYLSIAFGKLMPGCGLVVSLCGMISTMGLFVSSLACFARTIWGMADLGWLPKFLAKADPETHSPVYATLAQTLAIIPLLFLSFSYLQRIMFCLAAVSYLLTFGSFLRLRYTEADAHRPYLVPGGLPVAWLITMTKVMVFVFILASNFDDISLMGGVVVVNSGIAVGYWWYCKLNPSFAVSAFSHHAHQNGGENNQGGTNNNNNNNISIDANNIKTTKDSDDEMTNPFHAEELGNPAFAVCGRAQVAAEALHNVLHQSNHNNEQMSSSSSSTEGLRRRTAITPPASCENVVSMTSNNSDSIGLVSAGTTSNIEMN